MKRNICTLFAAFLSSAAIAAPGLDLSPSSEVFQYGDSLYTWDLESGGAVRVGAVWDGFAPASAMQAASNLFQKGEFVYQRNPMGETVKVEAMWDGRIAEAGGRKVGATLALKR